MLFLLVADEELPGFEARSCYWIKMLIKTNTGSWGHENTYRLIKID
jgi:hypothetical protein